MRLDYRRIKKFLQIGLFSIDLLIFMITLFSTNSSSEKYKEYTGASKFFLDLYIILVYVILIVTTILPGLIYHRIKKYIIFIFTDKGKVIISFAISLIYWFAKNKPQFVLGIILTLSSTLLLIYEFIFYFTKVDNFLSSKGIEFSNKGQSTFDLETLENKITSNNTPMGNRNSGYENNQSDGNNPSYEGNNSGVNNSNPQNPTSDQYERDVEISSGSNNPNPNQGFGYEN